MNIRKRMLYVIVGNLHLYLENTIEFLVEQFINLIILFLLMSFSLNRNTISVIIDQTSLSVIIDQTSQT